MRTSVMAVALLAGLNWMDPNWLLSHFGSEFFWISVLMVFVECGLLFPFLPGDTLLFAMGLFIASHKISPFPGNQWVNLVLALMLLFVGAFLGNVAGYEIGRAIGPKIYEHNGRILKRRHIRQTHDFFERHGHSALVIGRFVPFVRTFITLVAGVVEMPRRRFLTWSALGAALWVAAITLLGFFLGAAFPSLGKNIDKAIIAILVISVIPVVIEWWRQRKRGGAVEDDANAPGPAEWRKEH